MFQKSDRVIVTKGELFGKHGVVIRVGFLITVRLDGVNGPRSFLADDIWWVLNDE